MATTVEIDFAKVADIAWEQWYASNATELRRTVQAETPVDHGGLRGSVNVRRSGDREAQLFADASYAVVVHEGHGVILPRKPGGVLTWLDRLTGERVFTRRVGPVKANPYLVRGMRRYGLRVQTK